MSGSEFGCDQWSSCVRALRGMTRMLARTAVVASLLAGLGSPLVAQAAPRDEILARATNVKRQVDALDTQTEILSEDYNAASVRHGQLARQEEAATTRLKKTSCFPPAWALMKRL